MFFVYCQETEVGKKREYLKRTPVGAFIASACAYWPCGHAQRGHGPVYIDVLRGRSAITQGVTSHRVADDGHAGRGGPSGKVGVTMGVVRGHAVEDQ